MKKIVVILLATFTLGLSNKANAQGYGSISFNTFYNALSPYGRWVDDLDYGQVWIADEQGFEPYYNNGHWVYTSYGWTWASEYAWGWAPFHYGRWSYLPTWGWAWVPGYEWGPAWVGWCQNDGYYGWAPLSPGMGFNYSYNSIPNNYWRFVRQQYITGPSIRNHIVRPDRNRNEFKNVTIINNTQVNNNITYVAGPNRESVERVTRKKIDTRPVTFNGTDERTSVERKEVRMYRPDMKAGNGAAVNNKVQAPVQNNQPQRQQAGGVPNNTTQQVPAVAPANAVQQIVKQPGEQPANRDNNRRIKPMPVTPKPNNETVIDEPAVSRLPNEREVRRQPVQKDNEIKTIPPANQRQDELRQQRAQEQLMKEQQMKVQREQQQTSMQQERLQELRQQQLQQQEQEQKIQQQRAMQQQNEQRQNEIRQQLKEQQRKQQQSDLQQQNQQRQNEVRQQQLQEQRAQQRILQQQNRQQQNEIRQQRVQETPVRPQRALPMDQKPTSRKPNEN